MARTRAKLICRSGNDAVVELPDRIRVGEFNLAKADWEHYPPSQEDLEDYRVWLFAWLRGYHAEQVN